MRFRLCIVFFFSAVMFFLFAMPGLTAEKDKEKTRFVDLDGDGINDNEADKNGNTIPDRFEALKDSGDDAAARSILGNVFNSDITRKTVEDLKTRSDKFGSLLFKTRGLPQRCCSFGTEDEFGQRSVAGISTGGTGCVGGVCVR